jgi:hypothetical protein
MIKLELVIDEVNILLGALGKAPYEVSYALIEKIKAQAIPQLSQEPSTQQEIPLEEAK